MTKHFIYLNGQKKHDGWHAEVPCIREPKIKKTVIIKGEEHYLGVDGKTYEKKLFDKTFKVNKTEVKGYRYKGELIGQDY